MRTKYRRRTQTKHRRNLNKSRRNKLSRKNRKLKGGWPSIKIIDNKKNPLAFNYNGGWGGPIIEKNI